MVFCGVNAIKRQTLYFPLDRRPHFRTKFVVQPCSVKSLAGLDFIDPPHVAHKIYVIVQAPSNSHSIAYTVTLKMTAAIDTSDV